MEQTALIFILLLYHLVTAVTKLSLSCSKLQPYSNSARIVHELRLCLFTRSQSRRSHVNRLGKRHLLRRETKFVWC